MKLNIKDCGRYAIGDCQEAKINGLPGIGGYVLCLNLDFSIYAKHKTYLTHSHLRLDSTGQPSAMITSADLDLSGPIQLWNYRDIQLCFRFFLTSAQVEGIESLRSGKDFDVALSLRGELLQDGDIEGFRDHTTLTIPQSEWLSALEGMNYKKSFLYEMPVPTLSGKTDDAEKHVKKAQSFLYQGYYDECVGECRKLFELFEINSAEQRILGEARKRYPHRHHRESLSIQERWLLLRDIIQLSTNAPHHSGHTGYSRDQAKMILGAAVGYLSSKTVRL